MTKETENLTPEKSPSNNKSKTKYYLAAALLVALAGGSLLTWHLMAKNSSVAPEVLGDPTQNTTPNANANPQNISGSEETLNDPAFAPTSDKSITNPSSDLVSDKSNNQPDATSDSDKPNDQPAPVEAKPIDYKKKFGWVPNPPVGIELEDETELEDEIQADPMPIGIKPAPLEQVKLKARNVNEGIKKFKGNYVGLENPGQSCFMNAVIQMLYHDNAFRTALKREIKNVKISPENLARLEALHNLFKDMDKRKTKTKTVAPNRAAIMPAHLADPSQQEDAHQALLSLIGEGDWPENTLKINARLYEIYNEDLGLVDENDRIEDHLPLSININEAKKDQPPQSLQELVDKQLTLTDTLVPLTANEAKAGMEHKIMRRGLFEAPKSLIIQVARMTFDKVKQISGKNNAPVDIPDTLEISSKKTGQKAVYKLKSFVYHQGKSAKSGHYYTILREDADKYVILNDRLITKDPDAEEIKDLKAHGYLYLYQLEQDLIPEEDNPEHYLKNN